MEGGPKRVALLVGCNYPGKEYRLHGCVNDVRSMQQSLLKRFDFQPSDITVLIDDQLEPGYDSTNMLPTGVNIKKNLTVMTSNVGAGDLVLFYFSGHGTRGRFTDPNSEKLDEAIVPHDINLITNADFRDVVKKVPEGATFVFISDSCHSGELLDREKEQIGPSVTTRSIDNPAEETTIMKLLTEDQLKKAIGDKTDIGGHMNETFGTDASKIFYLNSKALEGLPKVPPTTGILISACQADETSADVRGDKNGGKPYGAFTGALMRVLYENRGTISYKDTVTRVRDVLAERYSQHACLYCCDENANAVYLLQQRDAPDDQPVPLGYNDKPITAATRNMGLGTLEDLKQAVIAYYNGMSTDSTKQKVQSLFNGFKPNMDGKVSSDLVFKVLSRYEKCDKTILAKVIGMEEIKWGMVDFNDLLVIYYASKSRWLFCSCCKAFLKGLHFVCVHCFKFNAETYNLCSSCFNNKDQWSHDHHVFLDNHALLQNYHALELRISDSSNKENDIQPEELIRTLEAAERSFLDDARVDGPDAKPTDKTKEFSLDLSIHADDYCSIM